MLEEKRGVPPSVGDASSQELKEKNLLPVEQIQVLFAQTSRSSKGSA